MATSVTIGKVTKLYGQGGGVAITIYDTFPKELNIEEPLYVLIDTLAVPLFLNRFERRGQKGALAEFDDIDNQTRAMELVGKELFLYVSNADLKESDGEIYLEDFVGFTALFKGQKISGKVERYIDSELNPLFEISIGDDLVLIPATDGLISKYSIRKQRVTFDIPEGLLDLNI